MPPFNSHHFAALWARRAGAVDPAVRRTVRDLGYTLFQTSLGYMNLLIYRIPEDKYPSGKLMWRRTGQLVHKERLLFDSDGAGCSLINDTPYAEVRHEMGKSGRRPTRRFAPWRDFAVLAILRVKPYLLQRLWVDIWGAGAGAITSGAGGGLAGSAGSGKRALGQATLTSPRRGSKDGAGADMGTGGFMGSVPFQSPRPKRPQRLFPRRRKGRKA